MGRLYDAEVPIYTLLSFKPTELLKQELFLSKEKMLVKYKLNKINLFD